MGLVDIQTRLNCCQIAPMGTMMESFFTSNLYMCTNKMVHNLFGCEFFHRSGAFCINGPWLITLLSLHLPLPPYNLLMTINWFLLDVLACICFFSYIVCFKTRLFWLRWRKTLEKVCLFIQELPLCEVRKICPTWPKSLDMPPSCGRHSCDNGDMIQLVLIAKVYT